MCLKANLNVHKRSLEQKAIKQAEEILDLLENGKQKEKLLKYEVVRQQGYYNMLDPRARQLTGLSEEDYEYIIRNYTELMQKYPNVKEKAKQNLNYLKSANIAKIVSLKGCNNCIEIVSNKLDVKLDDLCENCRKTVELYIST